MLGCTVDEIAAKLPARLGAGIRSAMLARGDELCVVAGERRLTGNELVTAVDRTVDMLQMHGVRRGDRIMLVAENGLTLLCCFLAMSELDGVAAVINARLAPRELALIEADCDPRCVVYDFETSRDAEAHARAAGIDAHDFLTGRLALGPIRDCDPETPDQDPAEQVLAMIYTTGTTGTPKGVMLTHRNLTYIAFVSGCLRGIRPGDPVYCVLPMSHVFGLSAVSSSVLFAGGILHLASRFEPQAVLYSLQHEAMTGFLGVPAMYTRLLETMPEGFSAPAMRFMYSGGAPLDPGLKREVEARFGMPLHNGFGLTESGPTICQTRLFAPLESVAVGFPLPGVDIRIQDEAGKAVADGTVGELWARGPNIMKGYFRKPELTAEVLQDGWLNTGDLAFIGDDGAINIAGRTKELIIRSGFNVYPPEVEGVLSEFPEVSIAAVLGFPVERDEEIVAFIQPVTAGQLDETALLAFARERLAGYKVPTRIVVIDELPAAPSGKILKHRLREMAG